MSADALLLWTLLLASLHGSASHGPGLDSDQDYEVVRPVRLHTVNKRHAEHHRPQTVKYALTVRGRPLEMHLERNDELLTKDYSETHYLKDGTRVTAAPDHIDHCYYQGRIVGDSASAASISTCDGLRGYFRTSEQRFLIEPLLSSEPEGDHAVFPVPEEEPSTPAVCGVTNTTWDDDFEPPTSRSRSRSAGNSIVQQQKYLELYLVADNRMYTKMKKNMEELRKKVFEVVNFVNMVYKPLRTFVALVGLEVWSSGDLINVTPPAGANLDAFMKWRNSELVQTKKHDNAHLLSGIDFEGATVGLAFIGTLCSGHSVGVVQDHNDRAIAVGATLAHEMGHNLGMNHDDSTSCVCEGDSCIMAAALSWIIPRSFSSCSGTYYEKYLLNRNPSCLLDKPDYKTLVSPPVCGNGFVEEGEQCDCGTVEECTNRCCNASTCTFSEGSQCAEGECCDDCKVSPRTSECRRRQDECDLAEYCDGVSARCPEDVFNVNGQPCDSARGFCYNGQCPQRSSQCIKMYGTEATVGASGCFNQNTRGVYYAFCKRPATDTFIPCQKQDIFCGKLFCEGGNSSPNYGRMVRFGNCKATFYGDFTKDYGQVDAGTECGDGKVCSENECVDLETAYRNTNCSAKCPGHAVCNHRSECQCEPGWMPPTCDTMDGQFSALSTGAIIGIAVAAILVFLGIVVGIVAYLWKTRQGPVLPTSQTQRKPDLTQKPVQPSPTLAAKPKPRAAPPPPPPGGFRPVRQALRPVPPPIA
ncbi:zinc metalloproteinase-disintegrin-like MTP8 isoform X2 [Eucyclogobius newberryi]|uniref:zinc metalloproteinase-disintegrin-like MTP8 isoform X2 n=1 Tax=Eucyclogobius newberryi TaxID=166745 RepID=UPI003B5900E6